MPATKYGALETALNKPTRHPWAGAQALARRHGSIAAVMRVIGLSHHTIVRGIQEEASQALPLDVVRVRAPGAGRKARFVLDPSLKRALERLVEPFSRGDR